MGKATDIMNALARLVPDFVRSDGQIEAKMIDVVGSYADAEALERQNTLDVINRALAERHPSQANYYRRKAIEFQMGDTVVYDPINGRAYYDPVIESHRVIRQAYVAGAYPNYTLMVNGVDSAGHLRPLTDDELGAFRTYFAEFQPFTPLNIASMQVAMLSAPNLVIYVRRGTDASEAVNQITRNLTAYESEWRPTNQVTVTEVVDVIKRYAPVVAVGAANLVAEEIGLDGVMRTIYPTNGVFTLTNGAFTFVTPITTGMIKTLD